MANLPLSGWEQLPADTSVTISNLTQFRVGTTGLNTLGVVHIEDNPARVGWLHWGYPAYAPDYSLMPKCVILVDPHHALGVARRAILTADTPLQIQFHYDYAQLWREVCKWAFQLGLGGNMRNLQ